MEAKIDRTKLITLVEETHGKIFTIVFVKKDGTIRKMNCRKGVTYCLKGGENKVIKPSNPYIVAFDMVKKAYRTINLSTVIEMYFGGHKFVVV